MHTPVERCRKLLAIGRHGLPRLTPSVRTFILTYVLSPSTIDAMCCCTCPLLCG